MDEIDGVLEALWMAAKSGDREALAFLQMFCPWAIGQAGRQQSGELVH